MIVWTGLRLPLHTQTTRARARTRTRIYILANHQCRRVRYILRIVFLHSNIEHATSPLAIIEFLGAWVYCGLVHKRAVGEESVVEKRVEGWRR